MSQRGDDTKARILEAAIAIARSGLSRVTPRRIGARLDIAHPLVLYHFGSADALRAAVVSHAFEVDDKVTIARLIMDDHASCRTMTRTTRQRYLAILGGR